MIIIILCQYLFIYSRHKTVNPYNNIFIHTFYQITIQPMACTWLDDTFCLSLKTARHSAFFYLSGLRSLKQVKVCCDSAARAFPHDGAICICIHHRQAILFWTCMPFSVSPLPKGQPIKRITQTRWNLAALRTLAPPTPCASRPAQFLFSSFRHPYFSFSSLALS